LISITILKGCDESCAVNVHSASFKEKPIFIEPRLRKRGGSCQESPPIFDA
jgi:hypothetical protein